jgi:ribosomal protein S18 acetylase RimI-like enzyme
MQAPMLEVMTHIGWDWPVRHYLGYVDGEPVTTSSVFLAEGVAGIQFVATLPKARGRGLGGAMTLASLYDARDLGHRAGVLQSSEMGYKVYLRLGFKQVSWVDYYFKAL